MRTRELSISRRLAPVYDVVAMLVRAHTRPPLPGRQVELVEDGAFAFLCRDPEQFDVAVLNLILSVVPTVGH